MLKNRCKHMLLFVLVLVMVFATFNDVMRWFR